MRGRGKQNILRTIRKMRRDEAGNVGQRIQFHISTRLGVSQFSVLVSPSDWKSWSVTRKTTTSTIARNPISFFFSLLLRTFVSFHPVSMQFFSSTHWRIRFSGRTIEQQTGYMAIRSASTRGAGLRFVVGGEPRQTFVETIAAGGARRLDVPIAVADPR